MSHLKKPEWLKTRLAGSGRYGELRRLLGELKLNTVCTEASCPNMGECWERGSVTVMILGGACTRNCRFCNVDFTAAPRPPDPEEPEHTAAALAQLKLKHAVITSVTRDDLSDGGSRHWAATISAIKQTCPWMTMEALIPDFKRNEPCLDRVLDAGPNILSHNLETVQRLAESIRPHASHETSLHVLKHASARGFITKSSLMLGMGETDEEVVTTMKELRRAGVRIIALGQYLQPSKRHAAVKRYVQPEKFKEFERRARELGFDWVESGPLVRSSYRAEDQSRLCKTRTDQSTSLNPQ